MGILNAFPSGSDGVKIQNDGIDTIERDKLNFLDHDVTDNSTDESTDVAPHRLTAEELTDIVSPLPGYQTGGVKYSTSEQVIGEWIDGKPIYQTTVNCGAISSGATNCEHGISNIEKIISYSASICRKDKIFSNFIAMTIDASTGAENPVWNFVILGIDATSILFRVGPGYTGDHAITDAYVTLQYTKTTD